MKKFVSLLIAIVLVISMVATVGAASFYDVGAMYNTNRVQETAIQALSDAGIVFGYNGYYRPNDTITRAEVCAIITRCLYGENGITYAQFPYNVNTNAFNYYNSFGYTTYNRGYNTSAYRTLNTTYNTNTYSDVNVGDWGYSYIMTATRRGLVNGYPDGTFRPDRQISYDEMCAIILRAIGYKTTGTWPAAVNAQASQLGITSNLTGIGSTAATRGDVAVMIYNARGCRMLSWNGYQNRYTETNRFFGDVIGLDTTSTINAVTGYTYAPGQTYTVFVTNDGMHYNVTFHVTSYVTAGTPVIIHINKFGAIDQIYNTTTAFVIDGVASDVIVTGVAPTLWGNQINIYASNGQVYTVSESQIRYSAGVDAAIKAALQGEYTINEGDKIAVGDRIEVNNFNGFISITVTGLAAGFETRFTVVPTVSENTDATPPAENGGGTDANNGSAAETQNNTDSQTGDQGADTTPDAGAAQNANQTDNNTPSTDNN